MWGQSWKSHRFDQENRPLTIVDIGMKSVQGLLTNETIQLTFHVFDLPFQLL